MRVRDPQGERWSVRRRWWPWRRLLPGALVDDQPGERLTADPLLDRSYAYIGRAAPSSHGLVRLGALPLALVEMLLQAALVPFALLGRALGLPWSVEVRYGRRRYHEARVRGWAASGDRVRQLAQDIEQGRWPHHNIGRLAIGDDGSVPTSGPRD